MPTCPICDKDFKYINNSHLKSHGLTPTQFKEQYPEVDAISMDSRKAMADNGGFGSRANKIACQNATKLKELDYYRNPKKCFKCKIPILYEKRLNKFCSHSCAASSTNMTREVQYSQAGLESLKISAIKNLSRIQRKIGITQHKNCCIICHSIFHTTSKNRDKKTCSHNCKKKNHSLNNFKQTKTFGKCGYYQGIYCASSWELVFLIYNRDLGKDIRRCELNFKYLIEKKEKLYFPDFFMDGLIYEVKGWEREDVAIKKQAVVAAGYEIEIVRKKQIEPMLKSVKHKYGVKDVTELYDKKV